METTTGKSLDLIFSLFAYVGTLKGKCVILLDNIDSMILSNETNDLENSLIPQSKDKNKDWALKLFIATRSALKISLRRLRQNKHEGKIFLLCTTHENNALDLRDCFDYITNIQLPDKMARYCLICDNLSISSTDDNTNILIDQLTDYTIGRSAAEIVNICREVIGRSKREPADKFFSDHDRLIIFQDLLRNSKAMDSSVGALDGLVDLKVEFFRWFGKNKGQLRHNALWKVLGC